LKYNSGLNGAFNKKILQAKGLKLKERLTQQSISGEEE